MFETNGIVIRKALVTLPNGVNLPSALRIEAERIQGHAE